MFCALTSDQRPCFVCQREQSPTCSGLPRWVICSAAGQTLDGTMLDATARGSTFSAVPVPVPLSPLACSLGRCASHWTLNHPGDDNHLSTYHPTPPLPCSPSSTQHRLLSALFRSARLPPRRSPLSAKHLQLLAHRRPLSTSTTTLFAAR